MSDSQGRRSYGKLLLRVWRLLFSFISYQITISISFPGIHTTEFWLTAVPSSNWANLAHIPIPKTW